MTASLISKSRFAVFSSVIFSVLALSARSAKAQSTTEEDKETCKNHFAAIYKAIKAYRADKKDLPPYLSDLVPKYIKDPNVLVCPTVKRTGNVVNYGINDPRISTARRLPSPTLNRRLETCMPAPVSVQPPGPFFDSPYWRASFRRWGRSVKKGKRAPAHSPARRANSATDSNLWR